MTRGPSKAHVEALKMTETPDVELIDAILEGSESAFQQLIERYQDRLFGLLGRLVRDRFAVEDLAQEVFVKVFRKLHTFQQDSSFYTWVYRIAVNTATDYLSRRKRRRLHLVADNSTLEPTPDGESGAVVPLLDKELREVTRQILEGLPEKYRTILILREYEDLAYTAIAEVLGCSIGTVESRLFRARQTLKQKLGQLLKSDWS